MRRHRVALLILAALVLVAATGYAGLRWWKLRANHYDDQPFERQVWLSNAGSSDQKNPRGLMAYDVQKRFLKRGMTREAVQKVLGKPDAVKSERLYSYNIGNWGGCFLCAEVLEIGFDKNGRLTKAKITEH
jgi:hypothetical protein